MAKIGLRNFRYGVLTEAANGTPTYDGAHVPGKAISCNVDVTNNSAVLYADDVLAESDYTFQSAAVTMGIDDEDTATVAALLGHSVGVGGEVIRNADDTAPYVGFGRIVTKIVNGVRKYKVAFLFKVKFADPSADNATKGESVEFGTTEISGTASALKNGKWGVSKVFDDYDTALAYLEGLLGAAQTTYTVTFNPGNGTLIDEAPTTVTCDAGESVTLLPDWAFVADAGSLAGWAKTSTATEPDYAPGAAYTPSGNVTLYAVIAE